MRAVRLPVVIGVLTGGAVLLFCLGAGEDGQAGPQYKSVYVPIALVPARAVGESEVEPNAVRFAKDLDIALNKLAKEGYEVVSIVPMLSGIYRWSAEQPIKRQQSASAFGYGYGYSVTTGVTVSARKR